MSSRTFFIGAPRNVVADRDAKNAGATREGKCGIARPFMLPNFHPTVDIRIVGKIYRTPVCPPPTFKSKVKLLMHIPIFDDAIRL